MRSVTLAEYWRFCRQNQNLKEITLVKAKEKSLMLVVSFSMSHVRSRRFSTKTINRSSIVLVKIFCQLFVSSSWILFDIYLSWILFDIYLYLQFVAAPILKGDNQMKDIMVSNGENATFLCNVSSLPMELPPSPPKWKKNGLDLDIGGGCEWSFFF
mgnify:CR=1 FL=1